MVKKLLGTVMAATLMTLTPVSIDGAGIASLQLNDACARGTCWKNYAADCIIDGHKTEDACDASTPGCDGSPPIIIIIT